MAASAEQISPAYIGDGGSHTFYKVFNVQQVHGIQVYWLLWRQLLLHSLLPSCTPAVTIPSDILLDWCTLHTHIFVLTGIQAMPWASWRTMSPDSGGMISWGPSIWMCSYIKTGHSGGEETPSCQASIQAHSLCITTICWGGAAYFHGNPTHRTIPPTWGLWQSSRHGIRHQWHMPWWYGQAVTSGAHSKVR